MKYFAYVRKSTEGEERQALSIEAQINKVKEFFPGLNVVEFIEERRSAFKPYNRPAFARMLERIKRGDADGVITWHPDRLSRNEVDAASITYMLRLEEIKDLKFGSYNFDNSPEGIWMLQMALSQSQYSSAKLGKDVKRGMEQKVKNGWMAGVPPHGYINKDGIIAIDPQRFKIVRRMWDMLLTGNYSVSKIANTANNEWGFRTFKRRHSGDKPISFSGLHILFNNIFFTGNILFKGQEYEGKHKPMISVDEFDLAQRILGKKGKPRAQTHYFPFTGIIRCGECGCMITAEEKRKHIKCDNTFRTYTYYRCTRRKREANCKQPCITVQDLELQINQFLKGMTILPKFKDWALEILNKMNDEEIGQRQSIHKNQQKTLLETQNQLDSLTKMRYRELINDDEYLKAKKALQTTISGLESELKQTFNRAKNWLETTDKAFEFAVSAREAFMNGNLESKRTILNSVGTEFILKDRMLYIKPHRWIQIIQNEYPTIELEYNRLEPIPSSFESLPDTLQRTWQAQKDLNPHLRFWRPACYH